jgi:hypothetical protein
MTCGKYGGQNRYTKDVEGKRLLWKTRCRWEDNIRINLQKVLKGDMDWIDLAEDRDRRLCLVKAIMNIRFPQNAWNFVIS